MSMIIETDHNFEDIVYLKTDPEQLPRIVTRFVVSKHSVIYELNCGTVCSAHYGFEISSVRNILIDANV